MHRKVAHLSDWHQLLVGNLPWSFLLEVLLRASLIYMLLMFAMRALGKRVAAQLTVFELSVVVVLAATIGAPLETADKGLVPPLIIFLVVLFLQRGLSELAFRYRGFEKVSSGGSSMLVRNGRLLLSNLHAVALPRERLYAILRSQRIQHLGQVQFAYLEASGSFTVIRSVPSRAGLSILPQCESELREEARVRGPYVCGNCGALPEPEVQSRCCWACRARAWTEAVTELKI